MSSSAVKALILSLALCSPAVVGGQEAPPFRAKIVDSLRAWMPTWVLVSDQYASYEDMRQQVPQLAHLKHEVLYFMWGQEESWVSAHVYNHRSPEEATGTYDWLYGGLGLPRSGEAGPPQNFRAEETKLPSLGDDSYLLKGGSGDSCQLVFRKGKAVVYVQAPSPDVAKEFAVHIAEELPAA
jgi:hypothetical protein